MRRREFITLLGGAAAALPLAARAQQRERIRRIGVFMPGAADPEGMASVTAFVQSMAQLGWIDGQNMRIDYRWGGAAMRQRNGRIVSITDVAAGLSGIWKPGRR